MNLIIRATKRQPELFEGIHYCWGEIIIGNFKERFRMPVDYWCLEDYEKQWKEGLERIKHEDASCLITVFQDPNLGMFVTFYTLHKDKSLNKIFIREQIIIKDILKDLIDEKLLPKELINKELNSKTCHEFIISPRDPYLKVDEWEIDM